MQQEKPGWESVADIEKLKYLILHSAEDHTLRIGELQPDPYFSDDKDDYTSLNALLDVIISAARSSQSKGNNIPTKKPIKQILHRQIQKKDSYAMPKNVRFGK